MLIGFSILMLARAHYVLYVRKCGNRAAVVITWTATVAVAAYWSWKLIA